MTLSKIDKSEIYKNIYSFRKEQLKTSMERVSYLLYKNEHLRNCDQCLVVTYWGTFEKLLTMHDRTSFETISRCRRKLQNDYGLFEADIETKENRKTMEKATKDWAIEY